MLHAQAHMHKRTKASSMRVPCCVQRCSIASTGSIPVQNIPFWCCSTSLYVSQRVVSDRCSGVQRARNTKRTPSAHLQLLALCDQPRLPGHVLRYNWWVHFLFGASSVPPTPVGTSPSTAGKCTAHF